MAQLIWLCILVKIAQQDLEPKTMLIPVLEREDPRDIIITRSEITDLTASSIPKGAVIGTASLRRKSTAS